ncbi:hypothetical protein [Actinophytocola sediminis]
MGARRPGRFSRAWQRQRAELADAERAHDMAVIDWIARRFGRNPLYLPPDRRGLLEPEPVRPYRGFRNGRARMAPTETGYEEPVEPTPRGPGNEHPWLADLTDDLPPTGPVLGAPDGDTR